MNSTSHMATTFVARRSSRLMWPALAYALTLCALPAVTKAQTDFHNTDSGRPLWVEDAYPVEYRAVELQFAPLRLERASGGRYSWGLEPSIAAGLYPRTQFEIGFPLIHVDGGEDGGTSGLAGVELGVLHNLNVETRLPALAIAAELHLPLGALAPDRVRPSVKGIATKTFSFARVNANARYAFGRDTDDQASGSQESHEDLSRWEAGVSLDRTFALKSLLVGAELVARQPFDGTEELVWDAGAGARHQLSPRVAADAGGGYRLTGSDRGWFVTFGAAVAVGMPTRRR